ncbi:MAG: hypothetical protein ACLRZ6_06930 [Lachnospiraceae bacterium]
MLLSLAGSQAVLVTKSRTSTMTQDELVNRISWEVLHNEQNADCKMYFI